MEKKKRILLKERYNQVDSILKENNIDLKEFLKAINKYNTNENYRKYKRSLRKKETNKKTLSEKRKRFLKKTLTYLMKVNKYAFFINPQIAAQYRIICVAERINPKNLMEAFINSFIESDPAMIELMKNINKYHKKKILNKNSEKLLQKRMERIRHIADFYDIPIEWYKKYADLKSDNIDF